MYIRRKKELLAKKNKYYVVWKGHKPGIYGSWQETQEQIFGFAKALYKGYPSRTEAEAAFRAGPGAMQKGKKSDKKKVPSSKSIIWRSISVDAACSGNPGVTEYQGVRTKSKEQIFHQRFELGTNNIGEFLALVHALALLQKQELFNLPIYTDSKTAMAWVRNKKAKTTLKRDARTEQLWKMIERAETWLKTNSFKNPILKWETEKWGEIPADFGRK